jgi:type VI secretion system protein ImpL
MRSVLNILKSRTFLTAVGVLCLSLLVWFAGPYVGFASVVGRLLVIMLFLVIWAVLLMVKQLRDARATATLTAGESDKARGADGAREESGRGSTPDVRALRESFAEAAAFLRRSGGSRRSLYELPWYAIIGPPGTGKTTLIEKSGLKFPVSQRGAARNVTGVGGTRNCKWWFTDEAVLLDTAGRFTTQDSDAEADKDGWLEFLSLLRTHRRRRPLNGLFVAYSAADLATRSEENLEHDALLIRERLDEIQRVLQVSLPVYFLVTQCDLVAGFTEFFDDLSVEARRQVWGFTFDLGESERGTAIGQLEPQFAALVERLGTRLMTRLNTERDVLRRVVMVGFPTQFGSLQSRLAAFMRDMFSSTRFEHALFLRGVYFTSGIQTGAPVDRMMAAVSREFGFKPQNVDTRAPVGRAFFIEGLLRGVVFPESGLAGTHRSLEMRKAVLQIAAYGACLAIGALAVIWLSASFGRNSGYLREVSTAWQQFKASEAASPTDSAPLPAVLPQLDSLRSVVDVAERHGESKPWSMRFGLYEPASVGETARDAYVRTINSVLVPRLATQLQLRLSQVVADPEALFETLKAYLLLGDQSRIVREKDALALETNREWSELYAADPSVAQRLAAHWTALLASGQALAAPPLNADAVASARSSLAGLTPRRLVYGRIARAYSADPNRGLRLSVAAGTGSERVLVRRSGRPLDEPLPYLYTRPAFEEISSLGAVKAATTFATDSWVFGPSQEGIAAEARLPFDVLSVYEDDYITHWDALIGDVGLRRVSGAADVAQMLAILSAADSPIKSLIRTVIDNTSLVKPSPAPGANPLAQLEAGGAGLASKAMAAAQAQLGAGHDPPGTRITQHFKALAGGNAAVDQCLASLTQISQQLNAAGLVGGANGAAGTLGQGSALDLAHGLQLCAESLPPPINGMMKQVSAASQAAAVTQVSGQLTQRLSQQIGSGDCKQIVAGHYPFVASSPDDVPLGNFGRLLGYGGSLDVFFRDNLAALVDTQSTPWRFRAVSDTQISLPPGALPAFQQAARVRSAFFETGGQQPQVHFTLTADSMDREVLKFVLEVDGQQFVFRHDPPQPWGAVWPGPAPGLASLRFEEDANGAGPSVKRQGPWAWFHLLDTAELQRVSDTHSVLTFRVGGRSVRLLLDANLIPSPFERHVLDQFKCPT